MSGSRHRLFASTVARRLYLQIYATLVASLVLVVILSGFLWEYVGRERQDRTILDTVSRFVALTLPPASAPEAQQRETVVALGSELNIAMALFDETGQRIAVHGDPHMPPDNRTGQTGWFPGAGGPVLALSLPDGRWLVADPLEKPPVSPILNLLVPLALVGICVGVGVYPIARRLTRRLETLSEGVERIGAGDLKARVEVEGQDEVAQLARTFNASADRIENLVTAHRLLLANASHELRTPLARIKLGLEMEQAEQSDARRAALKQDIAELNALIEEILVMSRLDAATPMERTETVDLLALAAEECARFDGCSLSGSAPDFTGDPRLLHRMIGNLLENAFKHGKAPVSIHLGQTADHIEIEVSDSGEGIAASERENVFQPFYRSPETHKSDGYGLGLPLVRKIAEAHGGSASVCPDPARPSLIRVRLPLSRDPA